MTRRLYFADLTHTGQVVAANTFPFGVSLVASRARTALGNAVSVEVFKYPADLSRALRQEKPAAVCFSHYLWNARLTLAYAKRIKEVWPDVPIVFGGPNYPVDEEDQDAFLIANPWVDFVVVKEGEIAGAHLLKLLATHGYDAGRLKAAAPDLPSVHLRFEESTIRNDLASRLTDLTETPSPYLTGLMDKFFDDVLIPVIETNRGCPFGCSFCVEGIRYYNKVRWFSHERTRDELEYISVRTKQPDLLISDSNFGMYKQDLETCRLIADLQQRTGWPRYVQNSSGKNQKERVVEAASILNGAMILTVSIQSSDPVVLRNVNRENISIDQIVEVGKSAETLGANSYCEVILGLPGDTKAGHYDSVLSMIDAGINDVLTYQTMMLPGAEIASRDSRARHGLDTRWRVLPRCFGLYEILGRSVAIAEVEEICVASETLSFDDYLACRALSLTVELFHNSGAFYELTGLLGHFGIMRSEFLRAADAQARMPNSPIADIYDDYLKDNVIKLQETRESLVDFVNKADVVEKHMAGELGSSELYKARAVAHFWRQADLHQVAFAATAVLLSEHGRWDDDISTYLSDLKSLSLTRKQMLHDTEQRSEFSSCFDFPALEALGYRADPRDHVRPEQSQLKIAHNSEQHEMITTYLKQYGTSLDGLGRLLLRAHVNKLYRSVEPSTTSATEHAA